MSSPGSVPPRRTSWSGLALIGATVASLAVLGLTVSLAVWFLDRVAAGPISAPGSSASTASSSPRAPRPASPDPTASTSKPPVTPRAPSRPSVPAAPETGLKDNSLYRVDLAAGVGRCELEVRRARPPIRNSRLEAYLRTVVDCLVRVFRPPLAEVGFTVTKPAVKTFRGTIDTPCGELGSDGPPALYCPLSRTIYWPVRSDDGDEAYTFARLGYVGLTAHEFGHHLQTVTGIAGEYGSRYWEAGRRERDLLSRRLELQAQCFEGVFLRHVEDVVGLTPADAQELRTWHSYTGDEDPPEDRRPDHGSSKAQVFWLERGLDGADFGRCNTWSAPKSRVK